MISLFHDFNKYINGMNFTKKLSMIVVLFVLSSCTSSTGTTGNKILGSNDKAKIYQIIHDNITTKSDARRLLGDPSDIDYYENTSQEKWTYNYLDRSSLMRNYVPIMNFFSRGTKDTQKKIVLIFDKDGILTKSLVSESSGETKHGFLD